MALAVFTTPPNDQKAYVRADMVLALDPPFAWAEGKPARTLHLTSGVRVIVDDTDENVQTAVLAMGGDETVAAAVLVEAQGARARFGVEKRGG